MWGTELEGNNVFKCTTSGTITAYSIPTSSSFPLGICAGPDGNLWGVEELGNKIFKCTPGGTITEYTGLTATSFPYAICAGPDGNLWGVELNVGKVFRCTTAGIITEFNLGSVGSDPYAICAGPDGNLWGTEEDDTYGNKVFKCTPNGTITEYSGLTADCSPIGICAGPDGNLWGAESNKSKIFKCTTNGTITEYATPGSSPFDICTGPDGNLWGTSTGQIFKQILTYGISTVPPPGVSGVPSKRIGTWTPLLNTSTTFTASNITGPAAAQGTAANNIGTSGNLIKFTTGALSGDVGGVHSGTSTAYQDTEYQASPVFTCRVQTSSSIATQRIWVGLTASALSGNSTPAVACAAFRFDTGAGDTTFQCYTDNGTSNTITSSGITVAASTTYDLVIDMSNPNQAAFYVNGQNVCNSTTTLPGSTAALGPEMTISTLTSTAENFSVGTMRLESY